MNIRIDSVHFDADKKLLEFIEKKVEKLSKFYDRIIDATVILKIENKGKVNNKVAELRIHVSGDQLFTKSTKKSFEAAVDDSADSMRRLLVKHKEKQRA